MRKQFWDVVCPFTPYFYIMFVLNVILYVLAIFAWFWVQPGTGAYVVLRIDIVVLTVTLAGVVWVLFRCNSQ